MQDDSGLLEKAKQFAFTSMAYCEPEDLEGFELVYLNDKLILLKKPERQAVKLHWASNDAESLLSPLTQIQGSLYIEFIPESFLSSFEGSGFTICSEFCDFFNPSLKEYTPHPIDPNEMVYLDAIECEEASRLTYSCEAHSRGFHGDTAQWFREWLDSEHGNVLVLKEGSALAGLCCVSLYGFESEKGPVLWVRELAVKPEFRGRGYGRRLLEQAFLYGLNRGAVRGFLLCDIQNDTAIQLYRSLGFERKPGRGQINMERK
ncbi:MAG: GNAT family N-acetyltransferase [Clostridia bacterium]|nr:GNAT family N-acetyltransferase [Clostridia bacterium]